MPNASAKINCSARPWDGKSLIEHALDAIPRECFARVLVVTQYPEITALAKECGFETLQNGHPERGQSETIRLGTRALSDCDAICFMVADQPLLRRETLAREVDFFSSHRERIVALGHNGARGNPCLFPARFFPELLALEGDVGGSAVIKNHLDALLLFESPEARAARCGYKGRRLPRSQNSDLAAKIAAPSRRLICLLAVDCREKR